VRVITSFVVGVLTRHLGTKALSLVLSILVFAFVQNTLTGTRDLQELTLRFELHQDLRDNFVLLQDTVTVRDVRIQGLRRIVDPLAKELRGDKRVVLTEGFLSRYDRMNLVIKPAVLRDILGDEDIDITMGGVDQAVKVDRLVERSNVLVDLVPDENLTPPEEYQGTQPDGRIFPPEFNVKQVRLIGPSTEMPPNPGLKVDIHLDRYFTPERQLDFSEEREVVQLQVPFISIDWQLSGIRPGMVKYFKVASDLTNNPVAAATFERSLSAKFELMARLEPQEVKIPIVRRDKWKSDVDFSRWVSLSTLVTSQALDEEAVLLEIRVPKTILARYPDLLKEQLVLVLDVTAWTKDSDELVIPFHLDVRDRSHPDLLNALQRIEIVSSERVVRFRPREP